MSTRIEWVEARVEMPEVVSPDEVGEVGENDDRDWGIGAGGVMIYGTPEELHLWLMRASDQLAEPLRKHRNRRIRERRAALGEPKCEHEWVLTENGYTRWWRTEIEGDRVIAYYGGSEDWSDDGDGVYLKCDRCQKVKPVADPYEIDYR